MQFEEIVSLVDKIRKARILANLHPFMGNAEFDTATNIYELRVYYENLKEFVEKNITIRMVLQGGSDAINAAGINPWCINEGLASGEEFVTLWR